MSETTGKSLVEQLVELETLDEAQEIVQEKELTGELNSLDSDDLEIVGGLFGTAVFDDTKFGAPQESDSTDNIPSTDGSVEAEANAPGNSVDAPVDDNSDDSPPISVDNPNGSDTSETDSTAGGTDNSSTDPSNASDASDNTDPTADSNSGGTPDNPIDDSTESESPATDSSESDTDSPSTDSTAQTNADDAQSSGSTGNGFVGSTNFASSLLRSTSAPQVIQLVEQEGFESSLSQLTTGDVASLMNKFDPALLVAYAEQKAQPAPPNPQPTIPTLSVREERVNEGDTVTIEIADALPDVGYTWSINSGPNFVSNQLDLSPSFLEFAQAYPSRKVITDPSGSAIIQFTVLADRQTEGDETLRVSIFGEGIPSTEIPEVTVEIKDTSKHPHAATDGNDVVSAPFSGEDTNDRLFGLDGDDRIFGHGGDDLLVGGPGDDQLYGGKGTDTAQFIGDSSNYEVSLDFDRETGTLMYQVEQTNENGIGGTDLIASDIEYLKFGNETISLSQFVESNLQVQQGIGSDGADTLEATSSDDWIKAGGGNDIISTAVAGIDLLDGGSGFDQLHVDANFESIVFLGGDYIGQSIISDDAALKISQIELLEFNDKNVLLTAGSGLSDAIQITKGALCLDTTANVTDLISSVVTDVKNGDTDIASRLVETSGLASIDNSEYISRLFDNIVRREATDSELASLESTMLDWSKEQILEMAMNTAPANQLHRDTSILGLDIFVTDPTGVGIGVSW